MVSGEVIFFVGRACSLSYLRGLLELCQKSQGFPPFFFALRKGRAHKERAVGSPGYPLFATLLLLPFVKTADAATLDFNEPARRVSVGKSLEMAKFNHTRRGIERTDPRQLALRGDLQIRAGNMAPPGCRIRCVSIG